MSDLKLRNLRVELLVVWFVTITPQMWGIESSQAQVSAPSSSQQLQRQLAAVRVHFPTQGDVLLNRLETLTREWLPTDYPIDYGLGSFSVDSPFPTQLSNVRLLGQMHNRLSKLGDGLALEGQLRDTSIEIESLAVHTWVDVKLSGVEARIRLDADCRNIKARWVNQELGLFAKIQLVLGESGPRILVSEVALPAQLPDPELTMTCSGPVGIESTLRATALQLIRDRMESGVLQRETASALGLVANDWIRQKATTHKYDSANRNWDVLIAIPMLNRDLTRAPVWPQSRSEDRSRTEDRFTVQIDRSEAEVIATGLFKPGQWSYLVEARTIDGFNKLMRSRFLQFFVFPELMNFPKSTAFKFNFVTESPVQLKCEKSNRLKVSSQVGAWMLDEKMTPIVFFRAPFNVRIDTQDQKINAAKIKLDSQFDADYVSMHDPNTSIATSLIAGQLEDSVKSMDLKKWMPAPIRCVDSETLEVQ